MWIQLKDLHYPSGVTFETSVKIAHAFRILLIYYMTEKIVNTRTLIWTAVQIKNLR